MMYSTFISYRRNPGDMRFLKNFKSIVESEALRITNIPKVFFDEDSIEWGNEFDKKIYESIGSSYFFIPIYHYTYLHVDNIWCARELYHALEVEKIIRESVDGNYCFILPIVHRGSPKNLPTCIGRKNAIKISLIEQDISNNKSTTRLRKFKEYIYDTLLDSFKLITDKGIKIDELCAMIKEPTEDEIKIWIKVQKEIEKNNESNDPPILNKNYE